MRGDDNSNTGSGERLISDDEDNNAQLMPDSEKAKWILVDDPLEAMELYFESLGFQDMVQFYGMKNMGGLQQHRGFKKRYPVAAAEKIQKTRKIFAEQVEIGEYLTRKQWHWAMGLDIPEPPEWPVESWPFARPFWHKNDLGARLDAWAKCDPLLLNESNPLRDSEASNYWKRHDPMEQYSSNPRNVRRKKRVRTPPIQAEPSGPHTPLKFDLSIQQLQGRKVISYTSSCSPNC